MNVAVGEAGARGQDSADAKPKTCEDSKDWQGGASGDRPGKGRAARCGGRKYYVSFTH